MKIKSQPRSCFCSKICFLFSFLLFTLSFSATTFSQPQSPREEIRVLFIGNSYTYFNNLGGIVSGIALANDGGPLISPTLAVGGGQTLRNHLENPKTMAVLENGDWDFVVLQEQSLLGVRPTDGIPRIGEPDNFHAAVRELVPKIRAIGAEPVLYMTWAVRGGRSARTEAQSKLAEAYLAIGDELDVPVAPVGLAWSEAFRRMNTLELHIYDGRHPTALGSYLAAAVIYTTITGKNTMGGPALINGHPVSPEGLVDQNETVPLVETGQATASELQEIAWEIVNQR